MNPRETLYIVESDLRRRELEDRSIRNSERKHIRTGNTVTRSTFFSRMIAQSDIPSPAPGWLQFVAMRRAAGLDPTDDHDPLFPNLTHPTRLIRRLLRMRHVLGMARVSADQLADACAQWRGELTPLHRRLPDVLRRYGALLDEETVLDRPSRLERLLDHAADRSDLPAPYEHVKRIEVSGLDHLTELEFQLFSTLLGNVEHASVEFAYNPDREEAFQWVLPTLEKFERAGLTLDTVDPAFRIPEASPDSALARVRDRIFREPPSLESLDPIPPDDSLRFYETGDPGNEHRTVARLVRQKLEQGIPPSDVCVVVRENGGSGSLVDELRDRDVPVHYRDPGFEPFNPGILALLLPVETASEGFERDSVLDLLRNRLLHGPADMDPDGLEEVFREAGIIRDPPDAWRSRLQQTAEKLQRRLDAYASSSPDCSFFPDSEETERERKTHTDRFLHNMDDLFGTLAGIPSSSSFRDLVEDVQTCMDQFQVPSSLYTSTSTPDVDLSLYRSVSSFRSFLDRVQTGLRGVDLSTRFEQPHELLRFLKQIWTQDEANRPSWQGPSDGVRVLSPDLMKGLSFQHVIVPHVNEGTWPEPVYDDPFLTDDLIMQLRQNRGRSVLQLTSQKRHHQLYQFHQVLSAATDQVVFTWSRMDAEGTEQLPSPFLEDVKKLMTDLPVQSPPAPGASSGTNEHQDSADDARFTDQERLIHRSSRAGTRTDATPLMEDPSWEDTIQARINHVLERQRLSTLRDRFFLEADPDRRTELAGPWSGVLSDQEQFRTLLSEQLEDFDTDRWSPTALERYAQCPYAYFSERILELEDDDRPALGMDRRREGLLLHEIMRALYDQSHSPGQPIDDQRLDEVCEDVFERWEYYGFHGEQTFWEVRRERIKLQVRNVVKFLQRTRAADLEVRPEVSFGEQNDVPALQFETNKGKTIQIEGRIDRLELNGDRQGTVIDYKNVARRQKYRNRMKMEEFGERSFQIPAYLLAAAGARREDLDAISTWNAGFVTMRERRGKPQLMDTLVDPDEETDQLAELRDAVRTGAIDIVEKVLNGQFDVTPDPCQSGCPYRNMCRYEDLTNGD